MDEVLHIIQKTSNPVEKAEYIGLVSDRLGIPQHVLMERFPTLVSSSSRRVKEKTKEPVQDLRSTCAQRQPRRTRFDHPSLTREARPAIFSSNYRVTCFRSLRIVGL